MWIQVMPEPFKLIFLRSSQRDDVSIPLATRSVSTRLHFGVLSITLVEAACGACVIFGLGTAKALLPPAEALRPVSRDG